MTQERLTRGEIYMATAYLFSRRNICSRLDVGAVAVKDKRIIASGYNGPLLITGNKDCECNISGPCLHAVHAEANLIAFAAKHGISLLGSTLYITHFPCQNCQKLIVQSGIQKVFYDQEYGDSNTEILESKNISILGYAERTIQISFK